MKLPWRQAPGEGKPSAPESAAAAEAAAHASPTLRRALDAVFRHDKPQILDLGPMCGETVVNLANRGAKVFEEAFVPPPPLPAAEAGGETPEAEPLVLQQPDGKFDLVLAWEHCDFVPPDRLREFCAELRRVLRPGGLLLLFSLNRTSETRDASPIFRYRLLGDDRVMRETTEDPARRRWVYPTREIERSLAPLTIQALHLHRNQMREFLALNESRER